MDGLQRLSTIFEFIGILKDEKGIPVLASTLVKTAYLPSLEGKVWEPTEENKNALDSSLRIAFKREKIDVKIVKKESDDSIKYELFQRLNTLGSKLSDQEVRNCLLVMLDKSFYEWLKSLSEDENFLNTISIADRLVKEKYNMELALRFIILHRIDPNSVRRINDFSEFITEKMIQIVEDTTFDRVETEKVFRETFKLLNLALSERAFKKFVEHKAAFEGKFLVAAFEAVAIGLGKNINLWLGYPSDITLFTNLEEKIKSIWRNPAFQDRYGAGVNVTTRVPVIIPLGEGVLVP